MPVLGILASSKLKAAATSFESIATVTVGSGGASTITFSSIPSDYAHLQLRMMITNSSYGRIYFNNDTTGANYRSHYLDGDGTSATAGTYANEIYSPFAASTSTAPYVEVLDILDYKNTNKYKTLRQLAGVDKNGSGQVTLLSGLWLSTSAINEIDLVVNSGNFVQYSHFALYGIKAA